MTKSTTKLLTALAVGAAMLMALPNGAGAANLPDGVKKLIPAAKKEGSLTVFGRSVTPPQNAAFKKAISAFYGFPIDLKMMGGLHTQKMAQVIKTIKAGAPTGLDLFWTSYAMSVRMEKAGVFQKYDWTSELNIPAALKSSEYGVQSHHVSLFMITYNTSAIKPADAPKTYDDLLNPRFKGKIGIPRSPAVWIYLEGALGAEKTEALAKNMLAKQDVKFIARFPDIRARVVSGEFPVVVGTDSFINIRKGAPVAHAKLSPIPLAPWGLHILKDSKSPNLAKLWGYWITSPGGQKTLHDVSGLSLATTKGTAMYNLTNDIEKVYLSREFFAKSGFKILKKFAKILKVK